MIGSTNIPKLNNAITTYGYTDSTRQKYTFEHIHHIPRNVSENYYNWIKQLSPKNFDKDKRGSVWTN